MGWNPGQYSMAALPLFLWALLWSVATAAREEHCDPHRYTDSPAAWKLSRVHPPSALERWLSGPTPTTHAATFSHPLYTNMELGGRVAARNLRCGETILTVHKKHFILRHTRGLSCMLLQIMTNMSSCL